MIYMHAQAIAKRRVSKNLFYEILGIGFLMSLTADLWSFLG